jgi:RNA polymerase sigma-70 factor (ECF subfamily)
MPQASPTVPQDDTSSPDADLVAQLRAGDESVMAQLVDEWSPAMLRIARSFVGSAQSAEDVVQDAWLGMLSGLARFEGRSSLRTWTFSILANRARTRGAREARTVPQPPLGPRGPPTAEDWCGGPGGHRSPDWSSIDGPSRWDTSPETVALSREGLRQLDRALSTAAWGALIALLCKRLQQAQDYRGMPRHCLMGAAASALLRRSLPARVLALDPGEGPVRRGDRGALALGEPAGELLAGQQKLMAERVAADRSQVRCGQPGHGERRDLAPCRLAHQLAQLGAGFPDTDLVGHLPHLP